MLASGNVTFNVNGVAFLPSDPKKRDGMPEWIFSQSNCGPSVRMTG